VAFFSGRGPQMEAFLRSATHLAFIRQRILSGRDVLPISLTNIASCSKSQPGRAARREQKRAGGRLEAGTGPLNFCCR
jgi:hypothetical protein